jgi:hypothetical protein
LIEERFGVGEFKASLGLALYVLGYGIGPLIFAPLSEGQSMNHHQQRRFIDAHI